MFEAIAELPIPFRSGVRSDNLLDAIDVPEISVIDAEPPKLGVVQIGPCNNRGNDE